MNHKQLVIGVLVILLVGALVGITASVNAASGEFNPIEAYLPLVAPSWEQVNTNGFGDPLTSEVTAIGAFDSYLYAGTYNIIDPEPLYDGAQIFRSSDGMSWNSVTLPGFGIAHDIAPPAILDFVVFNNQIYASTGWGDGPGQIWRSLDGIGWAPMIIHGFNDQDNVDITALAVYNGKIYAGVTNLVSGAKIYSSFTGDSNSWTQETVPGLAEASISGFAIYDGGLYAALQSPAPAQLWLTNGGDWTAVVTDGFGNNNTTATGGLAALGNNLYVGAGNAAVGAQLWTTSNGVDWEQAITPAFGDPNNQKIETVFIFQNQLYVSTGNTVTGLEVWRSPDGLNWEQANLDGFGDSNNTGTNFSNSTEKFLGQLYVGTANITDGGELWRMQEPYGVVLSPDDSLSGPVGQSVTYSLWITNTGTTADTYDLTATGQIWNTVLSTSLVSLAPSASAVFTVAVDIPPGATDQEADTAAITATSQGDASKTDSAVLTTTAIAAPVYGVVLSGDDSLSGPIGEQVIYTVAITNSGHVVDTFDLQAAGNTWITTLSAQSVTLAAGESQAVLVTVSIPPGATDQETDTATITATSQGDASKTDSAVLTTTAIAAPVYGVVLSGDDSLSGPIGEQVIYTVAITNTGNVVDTFDLLAAGNAWITTLSAQSVTLAAGESQAVLVTVSIPPGATDQETDTATITATSQGDASKTDSAVLTTAVSGAQPAKVYLPIVMKIGIITD